MDIQSQTNEAYDAGYKAHKREFDDHRTITVEIRDQYGTKAIYPVCARAKLFAIIAGTKTLTANTLTAIDGLGYRIVKKEEPFDWRQVP